MKKKILFAVICFCLLCGMVSIDVANADTNELVIVLDPGHDSKHAGAGGYGLREEQLNMKIAQYCYEELSQYDGVKVYMTHDTLACPHPDKNSRDCNIGRIRYAKSLNADVVVSLHNNSNENTSVQGAGIYYPTTSYHSNHYTLGKGLAQSIQSELVALGINDRGIEYKYSQDNTRYPDGSLADYYRVINEGKLQDVPTIIVEHVYLSNWSDAQNFLSSDEKLKALGVADATGIAKYFGLQKPEYASIFDAQFYSDTYPDIKAAFGNDEKALWDHFRTYGMSEGRRGNASFDVHSYRGRYADLQNAFGGDLKAYYTHYLNCGIPEGRDGTPVNQIFTVRFMQGSEVISTQGIGFGQSAITSVLAKNGAELKLNKSVSCITSDMDVQVSYSYIYNGVDYCPVFDADYYLGLYPDLRAAFGTNAQAALEHFVICGMSEGRRGNASFDVHSYRGRYIDLQNAFGGDLKAYYTHYLNCGIPEGRDGTPVNQIFTVRFMQGSEVISTQGIGFGQSAITSVLAKNGAELKLNKSVSCITSDMDVQVSYSYIYNGVDYGPVFDADYYLGLYPDLRAAFGTNAQAALEHFVVCGMREGRSAKPTFDVQSYRGRYADLQNAFGGDLKSYYVHYVTCGVNEGRDGSYTSKITAYNGVDYSAVFDADYYLSIYPDLRAAFGTNSWAALEHYVHCGMREGRVASEKFNVHVYRSRYWDLDKAFGNDLKSYVTHYLTCGIKEGRSGR